MEMHQLRYAVAAARTLSFTRAAEQCHVTQPALMAAVKKLEAQLGGPLFHRERNRPEHSITHPGAIQRPLADPVVERTVALATMPGRPHAPAVAAFMRAARSFRWLG